MADVGELQIAVDTGDVDKATSSLDNLAAGAGRAENAAGGAAAGVARVGESADTATGSVIGLTTAVEALATSWLGMKLIGQIEEIGQITMRYQMLDATMTVMANNAGMYGYQLREIKKDMEGQGISALQASKSLQIMAAAHIDLKRANELSTVAMNAAAIAGIDVSQAMDNVVRGLASGETRILRHMGLMVNFKQAYKDFQTEVLHSTRALTADEQASVRMNATIEEGRRRQGALAAAMGTAGGQMVLMKAQVTDLQELLGRAFNPALNELVGAFGARLKEATDDLKAWYASGEGAVWANNMKEDLVAVANTLEYLGGVFKDHISLIMSVGAAYAAFKLTETVFGWASAIRSWGATAKAEFLAVGEGALISDSTRKVSAISTAVSIVQAERAMADARVITLNSMAMALEAEAAAMTKNQLRAKAGQAVLRDMIDTRNELTIATINQTVAITAEGIATDAAIPPTVALTAAMSGLAVVMSALTFGLPIVIAALAAFAAWVKSTAVSEKQHSDDVIKSSDARIAQLHKEMEEIRKAEHMKKSGAKSSDYISKAEENSSPTIMAEKAAIEKYTASRDHYNEIIAREVSLTEFDAVAVERLTAARAVDQEEIDRHTQKLNELSGLTAERAKKEKDAEDAARKLAAHNDKIAAIEKELSFENRLAELKRQIADFDNQGRFYSAEKLKQLKEQAEYEAKIQEIKNRVKVGKETGPEERKESALLDQRLAAGRLAAERSAAEKLSEKEEDVGTKAIDAEFAAIEKLKEKNDEFGKSSDEVAKNRLRNNNALMMNTELYTEAVAKLSNELSRQNVNTAQQTIDDLRAKNAEFGKSEEEVARLRLQRQLTGVNDLKDRVRLTAELEKELEIEKSITSQEKLQSEASRMNKSKADEENAVAHLNAVAREGTKDGKPLDSDVYIKEWLAIKEKGHDVMADMVSGMKTATQTMAEAFAHFAETGKLEWKKMLVNILDSIVQMESTKAFQSLFMLVAGGLAPTQPSMAGAAGGFSLGAADSVGGSGAGNFSGGVSSSLFSPIGLAFKAGGGPVSGTQSYVVGEDGPEIFTPGFSGGITPNSGIGGGMNSIVNVNVNGGSIDSKSTASHPTAAQMGRDMEAAITAVIIKHQRPGGVLNPV